VYEADDKEADEIYDAVEDRQDERRRKYREENERSELLKLRKERPKIQQMFSDLKVRLSTALDISPVSHLPPAYPPLSHAY
jgi:pre-mRNA-processing factor 6